MPTVFAIAAHHDDIEFIMAGTMLRLRDAGWQLHYMDLANGCCGTVEHDAATIIQIRREEAKAAAAKLGATFHDSIVNDLEIFYELPTLKRLAAVVREVAPDIILTHAPSDYMEDHMNASRLAVTAAFVRGMPNFSTNPPRPSAGGKVTVYHAQPYGNHDPLGNLVRPSIFVDTTPHIELQTAALAEHRSQKIGSIKAKASIPIFIKCTNSPAKSAPCRAATNTLKAGGNTCTSVCAVRATIH